MKAIPFSIYSLLGALVVFQPVFADDPSASVQANVAPAAEAAVELAKAGPAANAEVAPYRVVDGDKVDPGTLQGWRTWRAMACDRCHGPNQEGLVGPSLVQSLKVMSKEEFKATVTKGRIEKGMPNFGEVPTVANNIDGLYAFLKGRSDGAINPGKLRGIE